MRFAYLLLPLLLLGASCSKKVNRDFVPISFETAPRPTAPDYSDPNSWAALPDKADYADYVPGDTIKDRQANAAVDVFFIHPTTFLQKDSMWNAGITDSAINHKTDFWVLRNQASVFNGAGRIYAPRYRQAHLKSYFNVENGGRKALYFAYTDVKRAFEYYLENYNNGRPIIIASHSQGSTHATLLLQDYFDGTDLQEKLVAAYMPGMPIRTDSFDHIPPCKAADDLGCFLSWCTFDKGHYPDVYDWWYQGSVTMNPITWRLDSGYSEHELHSSILYKNYEFKWPNSISVTTNNGILWTRKPKKWWRIFLIKQNYHTADYNLFWLNIRENVALRVKQYMELHSAGKVGD